MDSQQKDEIEALILREISNGISISCPINGYEHTLGTAILSFVVNIYTGLKKNEYLGPIPYDYQKPCIVIFQLREDLQWRWFEWRRTTISVNAIPGLEDLLNSTLEKVENKYKSDALIKKLLE